MTPLETTIYSETVYPARLLCGVGLPLITDKKAEQNVAILMFPILPQSKIGNAVPSVSIGFRCSTTSDRIGQAISSDHIQYVISTVVFGIKSCLLQGSKLLLGR
jgi:hypothetical protein